MFSLLNKYCFCDFGLDEIEKDKFDPDGLLTMYAGFNQNKNLYVIL